MTRAVAGTRRAPKRRSGCDGDPPGSAVGRAARRLHRERAARVAAERAAAELAEVHEQARRVLHRDRRLQELTEAFSEARLPADVAAVVLTQGCVAVAALRAHVCLLAEEGDALEMRWTLGYPDEFVTEWARIPLAAPLPLSEAARTGAAIFLGDVAGARERYPALRERLTSAFAAVPLIAGGRVLGVLGLVFEGARAFDGDDQAFILTVTRLCAQALDRARQYEAAAEARAEAEVANHAKDDFLSMLSHELRTPLTAILGWVELLRTRSMEPTAQARALQTIERNARIQAQLVDDILDVSRIAAGKLRIEMRALDPAAIVRAAVEVIRPEAEAKRIVVDTALGAEIASLHGDAGRLQQVAWNLLTNAVKFTPAGGRVSVSLDRVPGGVRLRVSDTGVGIEPGFLPQVFERFRQADAHATHMRGGLGLGLALVKHIVELHEGTVTAESAGLGRGTTFTVTLPAPLPARGEAGSSAHEGERASAVPGERISTSPARLDGVRVIIVDDEPDVRELVSAILGDEGAMVVAASSAAEALQAIERDPPDVLVSDIGMPHEDGYSLARKVRAQAAALNRQVPALALSAYAGVHDARMAELAGFHRHLAKPVVPARLVDEVARLAGR